MNEVVVELLDQTTWHPIGSVSDVEPPGSLSQQSASGREVYIFGWVSGDGPSVWRSAGGIDVANDAIRLITTTALDPVADLAAGPHEMNWHGAAGRITKRLRFRLEVTP